jgi:hypothetical protein
MTGASRRTDWTAREAHVGHVSEGTVSVNTWLVAYGEEQTGELILEDDCNSRSAF